MSSTVSVKPELIRWAVERSRLGADELTETFPALDAWQRGERLPTYKQLERLARKTMTPFGYFFLDTPPDESLPIPDFRTMGDVPPGRPSPNLIETIQTMQRRQAWMRDFLVEDGLESLDFVGSAANTRHVVSLAARIREKLGLKVDWAEAQATWEDALRTLRNSAERIGILVATGSVVGLNNHRPLDPQEFRGFVLCDDYAPLVFVNGADSKSAQMFTLAHELAHIWLGKGGVFNLIATMAHDDRAEQLCNQTAAEFLSPEHKLAERWNDAQKTGKPFETLARWFKVGPIVAARRALDLHYISRDEFFAFYQRDQAEWRKRRDDEKSQKKGGPDFYKVQDVRLGKRFAYAVVRAAREGTLTYRDAYQLTDLKGETFSRYANLLIQGDDRQACDGRIP